MRNTTLQRRFMLSLLPVIIGGPLVVGLAGQLSLRSSRAEHLSLRLRAHRESAVLPVSARLRSLVLGLESFVSRAQTEQGSHPRHGVLAASQKLRDADLLLAQWPEIEEVFVVRTAPGGILHSRVQRDRATGELVSTERAPDWLRRPLGAAAGPHAPLRFADDRGTPRLGWSQARAGSDGWRMGVLIDPARLGEQAAGAVTVSGGWLGLVRPDGRVISVCSGVGDGFDADTDILAVRDWSGVAPESSLELEGDHWAVVRTDEPELGLSAIFAIPESHLETDLHTVPWVMAVVVLLSTLLSYVFIHRLVGRVTRPLLRLRAQMERVARGDLTPRLPVAGTREMVSLSRSFNSMVSDLHTSHEALQAQSLQLSQALREAESVDRMKDNFLALVSHEVRTPLTSILGSVEFLTEEFSEGHSQTEVEFMAIVRESAQRLSEFMNDAILMASLQAKDAAEGFEEFSFSGVVDAEYEKLAPRIAEKELSVEYRLAEEAEVFVEGDWTLFQVAVQKVLDNAWRHGVPRGHLALEFVDRILEDEEEGLDSVLSRGGLRPAPPDRSWLALRIFNHAECIPQKKLDSLFQRFELVHDIDHHQRGSGLSLPIVASIVEYHGGTIEARIVAGEGMAFYLVLPVRRSDRPRVVTSETLDPGIDETVRMAREMTSLRSR